MGNEVDAEQIRHLFQLAISQRSEQLLREARFAVEVSQLGLDHFVESSFGLAIEIMHAPEFLLMEGNWVLFDLFEDEWDKLSDDQKGRLLTTIEEVYPLLGDEMPRFALTVLLGEYYGDERALEVLRGLSRLEDEGARCVVSHGLEHIARGARNTDLTARALRELARLRVDPSDLVRCRAELSYGRLVDAGIEVQLG